MELTSQVPLVTISKPVKELPDSNGNTTDAMFFAAYVGPSMNPTLRETEIMEIQPYDSRPLHIGDVVFFLPPDAEQAVVHRIIRITPAGISTRGDNNALEDAFLLQPGNIKGQVTAAWRGRQKRRKIAGGLHGRLTSRRLYCRRILGRGISPLLHPFYQAISRLGLIAWMLPASFRPRVVVFRVREENQLKLLLGKRVIGRYNNQKRQWQIHRPFQLFVNNKALPEQPENGLNRQVLTEPQDHGNHPQTQAARHELVLADGSHWEISAGDAEAALLVSQMGSIMRMRTAAKATESVQQDNRHRLLVQIQVDAQLSVANYFIPAASKNGGDVVCILRPQDHPVNLARLSLVFARAAQARGGFLIHGALAERDGIGVILTAPSGTGKTTASNRFPAPWRSLCDDTTLVVRDPQGNYLAHPWPTWSRFQDNGPGGEWDVQNAVPLRSIFFLTRATEERTEEIGHGQAVSLLVECVKQASLYMAPGLSKEEIIVLYRECFDNLCAMVRVVPVHTLHISLTGTFWQEIELALAKDCKKTVNKNNNAV